MNEPESNETELAMLLERVAGRDERPGDWRRLRRLFDAAPERVNRLLDTLEDDSRLRLAGAALVTDGRAVALPSVASASRSALRSAARPARRWLVAAAAAGWILAALVGGLRVFDGGAAGPEEPATAVVDPSATDSARPTVATLPLDAELPAVVLGTEPGADGVTEVVLVRRFLDRQPAERLEAVRTDDAGQAFTVPFQLANAPVRSF